MNPIASRRSAVALGLGAWLLAWGVPDLRAEPPANEAEALRLGQALAAELRAMRPGASATNSGVLRLRDARGRRQEIPVRVVTLVRPADWQVTYTASFTNGGTESLTAHHGSGAPVFELARTAPGAKQAAPPRTLRAGATDVPFAGSDFWVCDLGLEFLHWPVQRIVKEELSNSRLCHVLESVNPSTNGYAKVWSYVDQEFKGLLSAKGFDARGFVMKDFSTGNFVRVNEHWFLKDIRIRDERSDTRTELLYTLPTE